MITATEILNANLLIVDDQEANVLLLEDILQKPATPASARPWIRFR